MRTTLAFLALVALAWAVPTDAQAHGPHADVVAARHALTLPWNAGYYHTAWGRPVALVVPPTAHMQVNWGWGVSQSTMTPIYHQFRRPYPGNGQFGEIPGQPTPTWPSHTHQFGVYYIRAPY